MKHNYQKEMEEILKRIPEGGRPALLLHSCCAPCSSYVLEYLSRYFRIRRRNTGTGWRNSSGCSGRCPFRIR